MPHQRLQPRQLLQVDGEHNFIDHMRLQDHSHGIEREDLVSGEIAGRASLRFGIDEADQPQSHAAAFFDERRHLARPRAAADNQQIVIAAEALAHRGDAPIRRCAADEQQHKVDCADQQDIRAADVGAPQQVQAGVHHHQHNRQLADDFQDELDGIGQLQVAIEAGEVAHHRPGDEECSHQRQVVIERVDLGKTLAEKWELNEDGAQKVGDHEGDAGHPQVVEQRNRAEKLGASIEHSKTVDYRRTCGTAYPAAAAAGHVSQVGGGPDVTLNCSRISRLNTSSVGCWLTRSSRCQADRQAHPRRSRKALTHKRFPPR